MNRMAQKPDWTKIGVIAACIIGFATVVGEVLPYFYPPDPQHPLRFDFIQNQISFSISVGMLLAFIGIGATSFGVLMVVRRRKAIRQVPAMDLTFPDPAAGLTPLSPEYLALEKERDDAKKLHFQAQQSLAHATRELEDARQQLETPKIVVSVASFEVFEEVADSEPGQIGKLVHGTNNRILIRVHLKIVNEHRVPTNIQRLGIAVRGAPTGRMEHAGAPAEFPQAIQGRIEFGFPVDAPIDFWIEHSDAQSVVKSYFVVAATDGTGQQTETSPQQIIRVMPITAQASRVEAEPDYSPRNFDFDPKQNRVRLSADQMIALELVKSSSGTLGITVAPVNTTPRSIASYQVEVAEVNSWSEKHRQFVEGVRFNRKPAVRGGSLEPLTKHNGQWLVRVVSKEGKQFLTLYNDDSTPNLAAHACYRVRCYARNSEQRHGAASVLCAG
jgi:hypothetical protein